MMTNRLAAQPIEPLKIQGEDFVNSRNEPVRFWGQNLVALYPDHAVSDAIAKNLASLQINLVRPHHNLRPSKDWNPKMISGSLLTYTGDSRHFDTDALDRFDYLNAALKKQGIYLSFSINWTRRYLPGDVEVLKTDDADREAWMAAMKELNGWHWKKNFDVYKMLPVLDERVALLNEEFAKAILGHTNPYTQLSYARDPQVLTIELLNEASTEYNIICLAQLPDYWQKRLIQRWTDFAKSRGVEAGDLYKPTTPEQIKARAAFLRGLDEAYFKRMQNVVRTTGSTAPMNFSNLWRGDNTLEMEEKNATHVEDHMYANPFVASDRADFFLDKSFTQLKNKPYFVGELNQAEGEKNVKAQAPMRTMLPLATAAYGSLQNWTGAVWFGWGHGGEAMGSDGWASKEGRDADIGQMMLDGMMLDHLRTAGMIFRRGLLKESTQPILINLGSPLAARTYQDLMRHKITVKPGWQNIHGIRNTFATGTPESAGTPWLTETPPNPLTSDTGEIVKDVDRKQLTIAAPSAEAFSGMLDSTPPAKLQHLLLEGDAFATAILVADDGKPLSTSTRLILSRTALDKVNTEIDGPPIRLAGLTSSPGKNWVFRPTRPRSAAGNEQVVSVGTNGDLTLPTGTWHECELELRSADTPLAIRKETIHQTLPGNKIYTGDGGNAVAKGKMELLKVADASGGEVARVKGAMEQWGFVSCWFGLPSPAGKTIVRVRVYNDGQKTAKYMLYTVSKEGQIGVGELKIPTTAKEKAFVDVDVPVEAKGEWNGLTLKKAEKSALPSPWIDSVSVVLPD